MQGTGAKLTAKQERAITALLSHPTIEAAGEALGVNPATLHRWLQEPAFEAAYRAARREAVGQAIARLQQVSTAAVTVLVRVMASEKTPPSTRVAAAKTVLDTAIRAVELDDLQARIAALEARMGDKA